MAKPPLRRTQKDWKKLAERRLARVLRLMEASPALCRLGPAQKPWRAEVTLVGAARMSEINGEYRGKSYPTDVLSFTAQDFFRTRQAHLGELVICTPVMGRQARERGLKPEQELDVLLVHGLLHLLGLEHETSTKDARAMARHEQRLLEKLYPRGRGRTPQGLIERVNYANVDPS